MLNKHPKIKQYMGNYLPWLLIALFGIYLLYSKGYIAANFVSVDVQSAQAMLRSQENNITLLDVRTPEEYKYDGRIPASVLIPLAVLEKEWKTLDASKKVLVYCRSGNRSVTAARILEAHGFSVYNLSGGINAWKAASLPIEKQ